MNKNIKEKLSLVPHKPGCYLMKNSDGIIIYVGKSKNLKNRLTSYFTGVHTGKTAKLISEIEIFDYIVTNTEMEALLLELNLIKKYDPKYNIIFRDDKTYPYIELTNDKVPRLIVVRNPNLKKKQNLKLFGPYPNVTAARKTVDMINRLYPLRKCSTYNKKPCLYYHINECLGYCHNKISDDVIKNMKSEITSFLNGNHTILTNKIKEKMNEASSKMQYEKALEYKELLDYINITLEKQKVELGDNLNRDVVGFYFEKGYLSISLLFIRGGKLLDKKSEIFPILESLEEEITRYLSMFYDKHKIKPHELLVPDVVDKEILSDAFSLKILTPLKGTKKKMIDLACENAKIFYNEKMELIKKDEEKSEIALKELSSILKINSVRRIELFDNSNLFGSFNVSGMVVFIDGKPSKKEYRKFKITNDKNDDYGTMREVIYRRYFKVLMNNLERPNLIIVDGGIGQVNVAREVIDELGLDIMVCGLKKNDKHDTSELLGGTPLHVIDIDRHSELFHLLTRMQDEVHNFTINYHKTLRSKGALSSVLDSVSGIGEKRKKELLKKYRTISKMKEATPEELSEILPKNVLDSFIEFLNEY